MKVSTEQRPDRQAVIDIEIEAEELEAAMQRAFQRLVRQVEIPGFRRGKAPRTIFERRVGRAVLLEEAAQDLLPKMTQQALEEHKVEAYLEPQLAVKSIEPLAFTATVPLWPLVTLGDYKSIRLQPREIAVTEEQVDEVLDKLREQRGTWQPAEVGHTTGKGDRVTYNLELFVDGASQEEKRIGLTYVVDQEATLRAELAEALKRLAPGESEEVEVAVEANERFPSVTEGPVRFAVEVTGVDVRVKADLNEEFVAQVSDLTTVEALRERVRENLRLQAEDTARREMSLAVIDMVTDQSTIEMPPQLVENQIERLVAQRRRTFESQGLAWERVLEILDKTEEQVREEERPAAEQQMRRTLTLLEVAKAEAIEVSADEVDAEMGAGPLPSNRAMDERQRAEYLRAERGYAESMLLERRLTELLINTATEGQGYFVAPGEAKLPAAIAEAVAEGEQA